MVGWESRTAPGETTLTTITIVGAGGFEFPLTLGADFLCFESMRDAHLVLMDIDPVTLARTEGHLRRVAEGALEYLRYR